MKLLNLIEDTLVGRKVIIYGTLTIFGVIIKIEEVNLDNSDNFYILHLQHGETCKLYLNDSFEFMD